MMDANLRHQGYHTEHEATPQQWTPQHEPYPRVLFKLLQRYCW